MDRTVYTSKALTPTQAVRQIFGRHRLPAKICLLFADNDLLSIEMISTLGETFDSVKGTFTKLVGGDAALGDSERARELALIQVVAVWQSCGSMRECIATRRSKMEEDPNKIPEIPQDDHGDFRSKFISAHPDSVLTVYNEPHRKFVERVHRDFTVNSVVPFYEVGEVRVRAEKIVQRSGLAPTADKLIQLCQADDLSSAVATEEEVLNRLNALFMTLEYLNICSFNLSDGPIRYFQALQHFRRKLPGMGALLRVDKLVRSKVAELCLDQKDSYATFSDALIHVLDHCHYIWDEARVDMMLLTPRGSKRPATDLQDEEAAGGPASPPKPTKSAARRLKIKAKLAGVKTVQPKGSGKGNRAPLPSKPADAARTNRIPDDEWKTLCSFKVSGKPKCKFYNSSSGCTAGDNCKQLHLCIQCGGSHSWFAHHK